MCVAAAAGAAPLPLIECVALCRATQQIDGVIFYNRSGGPHGLLNFVCSHHARGGSDRGRRRMARARALVLSLSPLRLDHVPARLWLRGCAGPLFWRRQIVVCRFVMHRQGGMPLSLFMVGVEAMANWKRFPSGDTIYLNLDVNDRDATQPRHQYHVSAIRF